MSLRTKFELKDESARLIEALLLPPDGTRQDALYAWLRSFKPDILNNFSSFLDQLIHDCDNGLRNGELSADKLRRYNFSMAFEFKFIRGEEKNTTINQPPIPPTASNNDDDGGYINNDSARSPNDDRSDSMNPNNAANQAAMNNHSNQMNPNNSGYGSSRGR